MLRSCCFIALLWCAPASAMSLADTLPVNPAAWRLYPEDLIQSVAGYLASTLEFSGDSIHTDDAANGRLSVAGSNMILSRHDIALDFEDSVSRRDGGELQSLAFRYSFPVAGVDVNLALENSEQVLAATRAGQQLDARVEYRGLDLSASRGLWSWQGVELDAIVSHSSGTSDRYEESAWLSDTGHRLSSFGMRCSGQRDLAGGFRASTTLTGMAGWEHLQTTTDSTFHEQGTRFHKLTLDATLNRSVQAWDIALHGRYQLAPDDLASSEYLQVAGPAMMHGFNGQSMYVTEGGWLRMNARSPGYSMPFARALNSYLTLSVLRGWAPASSTGSRDFGASTGELSLHLEGRRFHASMSVGQILDLSGSLMRRPATPDVSLSLSLGI